MTQRERLLAALSGKTPDRVPIWLREGFPVGQKLPGAEDFTQGWMADPLYQDLFRDISPHAIRLESWGIPGGYINRFAMVDPRWVRTLKTEDDGMTKFISGEIACNGKSLAWKQEIRRGINTTWVTEHPVKTFEDLEWLVSLPYELDEGVLAKAAGSFATADQNVGDQGLPHIFLSSPIVILSGAMDFQMFLELSLTESEFFHKQLEIITERNLRIIELVFGRNNIGGYVSFGGSEQCTPPMMAPGTFDEYVVPYEGPLIKAVKKQGALVNVHCHGKVRHALRGMIEMDADSTDPVEPPPSGDLSFAEAREIAGNRLTLFGNLEYDELEFSTPDHIRQRVKEILQCGRERLVLGASAGPIAAITPRLAENYRAWIETALEFG